MQAHITRRAHTAPSLPMFPLASFALAAFFLVAATLILPCGLWVGSKAALAAPAGPGGPATMNAEQIRSLIRDVLRDNPQLVLEILEDNSEAVLEIAQKGNMLRKRKALLAQWEYDAQHPKNPDLEGRAFRGKTDAPVTLVSYSDFTCPYCRQSEYIINKLLQKFDGTLRVTFKVLPKEDPFSITLGKYATAAFLLDPEKGWVLFDEFFSNPEGFEREGDAYLKAAAQKADLDYRKLRAEAASSRVQAILDADRQEADALGVSGTPHFLVNDLVIRGAVAREVFEEAVEKAFEKTLDRIPEDAG